MSEDITQTPDMTNPSFEISVHCVPSEELLRLTGMTTSSGHQSLEYQQNSDSPKFPKSP